MEVTHGAPSAAEEFETEKRRTPEQPCRARPRIDLMAESKGSGTKDAGAVTYGHPSKSSGPSPGQEALNIVARVSLPSRVGEWPTKADGGNHPNTRDAGWVNKLLHQVTASEEVHWRTAKKT